MAAAPKGGWVWEDAPEDEDDGASAEALTQMLQQHMQALIAVAERIEKAAQAIIHANRPKKITRDANGRPIGIE
jgi:hypothetical protein